MLIVISIWIFMNNVRTKRRLKKLYIISLCIFEILLIYLTIKSLLSKDLICPYEVTLYEYIKVKLSNFI